MSWCNLPKIELHLHLEGAAPPAFVRRLAAEKGIRLDGVFDERGAYAFNDFAGFLRCYEAACAPLRSPEDHARLVTAVAGELTASGVVYAEIFVAPQLSCDGDVLAWRDHSAAMREAALRAEAAGGPILRAIPTCVRHLGPEAARRAALCAADEADAHGGTWTTGFGMGGDEHVGRQQDFAWAFDCAREAGLGLTTHAGEWRGPSEVRDALDLGVGRIGHGIRAVEDPALMGRLAERGIVLEVCPRSNVALGAAASIERHPIERLRTAGVPVTVSTDDPPFFGATMTREWEDLERAFGWGPADLAALNRTALDAAFCDEDTRARTAKLIEAPA